MVKIAPEQKVYSKIRKICDDLGYPVYDYLPGSDAEYPFIVLGEQLSNNDRQHKDKYDKETLTIVHVWHNTVYERGVVSKALWKVEKEIINKFGIEGEDISIHLLPDNSTGSRFWHGILEANIRI